MQLKLLRSEESMQKSTLIEIENSQINMLLHRMEISLHHVHVSPHYIKVLHNLSSEIPYLCPLKLF